MNNIFVLNLKNMLYGNINARNRQRILFSSFDNTKNLHLNECMIEDILPHLLVYPSMVNIGGKEKMWVATSMLV
ncbi:MAG: hypothetical protein KGL95_09060, partial [Patescibacteria group bacterium]|nr:hypothetical protein [Patescibacteria group bacterium]